MTDTQILLAKKEGRNDTVLLKNVCWELSKILGIMSSAQNNDTTHIEVQIKLLNYMILAHCANFWVKNKSGKRAEHI